MKLYELAPSPNNVKVTMALKLKGIEFESIPVDPADRSELIRVSGQDLTPVIEDDGVVLNDSEAILQYLDANYRDAPRLFPSRRNDRKQCEEFGDWVLEQIRSSWPPLFFFAIKRVEQLDEAARDRFAAFLGELESRLASSSTFGDGESAINDLRVAMWAVYALPGDGLVGRVRLFRRIAEVFGADATRYPRLVEFLRPWDARLS